MEKARLFSQKLCPCFTFLATWLNHSGEIELDKFTWHDWALYASSDLKLFISTICWDRSFCERSVLNFLLHKCVCAYPWNYDPIQCFSLSFNWHRLIFDLAVCMQISRKLQHKYCHQFLTAHRTTSLHLWSWTKSEVCQSKDIHRLYPTILQKWPMFEDPTSGMSRQAL